MQSNFTWSKLWVWERRRNLRAYLLPSIPSTFKNSMGDRLGRKIIYNAFLVYQPPFSRDSLDSWTSIGWLDFATISAGSGVPTQVGTTWRLPASVHAMASVAGDYDMENAVPMAPFSRACLQLHQQPSPAENNQRLPVNIFRTG